MKIRQLIIDGYKNLVECEIEFSEVHLTHAIIGGNGSGKSNLIEAILQILIGFYFGKPPKFNFKLEFEAQNRVTVLQRNNKFTSVEVDGIRIPLDHFSMRLHDGPAQVFFPELILVYYSGDCKRVQQLVSRYRRHFQSLTRHPNSDHFRPLFVQSNNSQADVILLALFAHRLLDLPEKLGIKNLTDIRITLRSPDRFDPSKHEPKLWNTEGSIRRIVSALNETAAFEFGTRSPDYVHDSPLGDKNIERNSSIREHRDYHFGIGTEKNLRSLASRLHKDGDNIYLALEALRVRGIFHSVSFKVIRQIESEGFSFDQLSEGEKQLLAVTGAIKLTNQKDNLVLLDEPDTHLNPHWSWDFSELLTESFHKEQLGRSTALMTTHDPIIISGMVRSQVLLLQQSTSFKTIITHPHRNPRGQGVANLLCSSEFFGLPSSLDKLTQRLLDERLELSIKDDLTFQDKKRLKALNSQLEINPGISERDPKLAEFIRFQIDRKGLDVAPH